MIDLSYKREILIKDVSKANFKLKFEIGYSGPSYTLDLNADDYIQGGKFSTGNIVSDMIIYINSKITELANITNFTRKTDFINVLNGNASSSDLVDCIIITDLIIEGKFEKLNGISDRLFWTAMFLDSRNVDTCGNIDKSLDIGSRFVLESSRTFVESDDIINMLVMIFMYSTSQVYRDRLTAIGCNEIIEGNYGHSHGVDRGTTIYLFDRKIHDYVAATTRATFMAKEIYRLSGSNTSNASGIKESLPRVDRCQASTLKYTDNPNAMVITASVSRPNSGLYNSDNSNVMSINSYAFAKDDCLLSVSLQVKYKEHNGKNINNYINSLYYKTGSPFDTLGVLFRDFSTAEQLKYDNLVYDMDIEDVVSNDLIDLSMIYKTYSSSNGTRTYEYPTLQNKKIAPTSRRTVLYEACVNLMQYVGLDVNKTFLKLDVDFKRFYGHTSPNK